MACIYGSERKFPTDSTVVVNPYEGVNGAAAIFLNLAAIPPQIEFDAVQLCSTTPPEYVQIDVEDFVNLAALNEKVYNNARRTAWFKGCKCKDKPTTPPPPPPTPLPPDGIPLIPFDYSCEAMTDAGWRIEIRYYGRGNNQVTYKVEVPLPFLFFPFQSLFIERDSNDLHNIIVYGDGNFIFNSNIISQAAYRTVFDWTYYWCGTIEDPELPPEGEQPTIPDPCEGGGTQTCRYEEGTLKQVDKLEIIADLRLWTSESNNRIRDELADIISGSRDNIKNDIALFREELFEITNTLDFNAQQYRDDIKIRITEQTQDLKDWIDGAKNQIFASIASATAAIGASIITATTTITAAITAATTTVTGAITTATTTLTNIVNGARDAIESTVRTEVEKYATRYRKLTITFTQTPQGVSVTYGLRDAPDKYALGWVQFYRQGGGGSRFYYDRQFIVNLSQDFICQEPNIDAGYVLHILPNYQVSASLGWTNKKE